MMYIYMCVYVRFFIYCPWGLSVKGWGGGLCEVSVQVRMGAKLFFLSDNIYIYIYIYIYICVCVCVCVCVLFIYLFTDIHICHLYILMLTYCNCRVIQEPKQRKILLLQRMLWRSVHLANDFSVLSLKPTNFIGHL